MKRYKVPLFAAALGLGLMTGTSARAASSWSVDWSPTSTSALMGIDGSGPTIINFSNPSFTTLPPGSSGGMPATNLTLTTSSPGLSVSQANAQTFQLIATVYDGTSKMAPSQTVTFTGKMWGNFSSTGLENAQIGWVNPSNPTGPLVGTASQTVTFAGTGDKVTLSYQSLVQPLNPGAYAANPHNTGAIGFFLTETPGSGPIKGNGTPEPSTMLMGCMGLSFLGLASWRKRLRRLLVA